ncbi:MAG: hypothetical protein Q7T16_02325 [Candidatus Burarchaeum sp.]|nr:hypothetical protein [Candidatus Burarchaeum sp.]MDO8339470.1 hypothetical protein [Candidatus Burarchaeum sp.]
MGMAGTMTMQARQPLPLAGFFNRILTSVHDLFVKPPLPDPALTFSEIKRIHAAILESPKNRNLGNLMHAFILDYETQTRDVAVRQIRNAPRLKDGIMRELKEKREKAYALALEATGDSYYGSKLGHYDWKRAGEARG